MIKPKPLELLFEDLLNFEELLDHINRKGKARLTGTENTKRMLSSAIDQLRKEIQRRRGVAKHHIDYRKPRASKNAVYQRDRRDKQRELIYRKIDEYFNSES